MRTIVDQFSMFPPSKAAMTARLLNSPRGVSQSIPVARSVAPSTFFKGAQGQISPAAPWYLGMGGGFSGVRMNPLSGFGAANPSPEFNLLPGISFAHVWSKEDLLGSTQRAQSWMSETNGGPRGLEYPPFDFGFRFISSSLLSDAQKGWAVLLSAADGNEAAAAAVDSIKSELSTAMTQVDQTWDAVRFGIVSRSPELETKRHAALKTIARLLGVIVARAKVVETQMRTQEAATQEDFTTGVGTGIKPPPSKTPQSGPPAATKKAGNPYLMPGLILGGFIVIGVGIAIVRSR